MNAEILPLQNIFNRLRDHGLSLGIDDYMALLRALQAGIGLSDGFALKKLCMALWIKSDEEKLLFNSLYEQMLAQSVSSDKDAYEIGLETQSVTKKGMTKQPAPEEQQFEKRPSPSISLTTNEPTKVVQAIRHGRQLKLDIVRPNYSLLTDYFPVTSRQMKQSWRHLRRPVREGPPIELDIESTVKKISREGFFSEPVLLPRRLNRAKIYLLVDQGGSMVPFHAISLQLVNTIQRGGLLQQMNVYYFHDYPGEHLYIDPARLTAKQTSDVLMSIDTHSTVLLVSDAGAARGNLDKERIKQTKNFIQKLRQYVRRFVWINPLPNDRWPATTAGEVARFVPMFDMSRRGLDDAVNALRGHYFYWEKLYSWMI